MPTDADLSTILDSLHAEYGRIGAHLLGFSTPFLVRLRLTLFSGDRTPPYSFPGLEVTAHEVLDYAFRPAHNLFEGTASLELLDRDDKLLTKRHFDSCDADRWDSPEDPKNYRLLRCGHHYVIAKRLTARLHPDPSPT